jgi:prevent-host-death family protein
MRHVQASDAKAKFADLLDQVEQGETIVITRHGKPIARIVPEDADRRRQIEAAVEGLRALAKTGEKVSLEEILAWRHEGHKY